MVKTSATLSSSQQPQPPPSHSRRPPPYSAHEHHRCHPHPKLISPPNHPQPMAHAHCTDTTPILIAAPTHLCLFVSLSISVFVSLVLAKGGGRVEIDDYDDDGVVRLFFAGDGENSEFGYGVVELV
ncbi:hypothetical protein L3X38_026337 [Prunus dulcis]|uniref:Uncharacterized protein n=1 Tax=Prunus dulcis TaxID=3755 RepID=A0AAD4VN44_PRUDU|nr:hypothetical protein L3X38_026337 [Prunus dulcis]